MVLVDMRPQDDSGDVPDDLTLFQINLLRVTEMLAPKPHGAAIMAELEHYYQGEIDPGRLYPNLDVLVQKGLVSKGEKDRRSNWYSITDRGRRDLDEYRRFLGTIDGSDTD